MPIETAMAVARHGFGPTPSTEEVVLAPVWQKINIKNPAATLLLSAAGVAYLPGRMLATVRNAFTDAGLDAVSDAFLGSGLPGSLVAGRVSDSAKKSLERRAERKAQATPVIPEVVQKALERPKAFAAGYTEVVSVRYRETPRFLQVSACVDVEVAGSSGSATHQILLGPKPKGSAKLVAGAIAESRAMTGWLWLLQEALARLQSRPATYRRLGVAGTTANPEELLEVIGEEVLAAGLTPEQVVTCALQHHPEFAQFASPPGTADLYSGLTWMIAPH